MFAILKVFCDNKVTFPKPLLSLLLTSAMMQSGGTLWFPAQSWCHMTRSTSDFEDPRQKPKEFETDLGAHKV